MSLLLAVAILLVLTALLGVVNERYLRLQPNGEGVSSHQGSKDEQQHLSDLSALAFYPITFPMIVGPGTIATLIIYSGHAQTFPEVIEIGGVVAIILVMLFVVLFFASSFGKVLSDTMRVIMTRLMGMILLAIAVAMVVNGLKVVLPGLG